MIHVQVIPRSGDDLKSLIRGALQRKQLRSFKVRQVKGGLLLSHSKHPGTVELEQSRGVLLATVMCKNHAKEWQLLESLVGRLVYHFRAEVAAMNIQPTKD